MKHKTKTEPVEIAVIGGSGLYELEELKDKRELRIRTPFGYPSDVIVVGNIDGTRCAFLPRHGRGHRIFPHEIPQRANIYALKSLGVKTLIAVSAVGSLREDLEPRDFVFPDQLVDESKNRISTFFGRGIVAHASFAEPFCHALTGLLYERSLALGMTAHRGNLVYACMEGPQFSTKAESEYHRRMGYSIIGMTVCPEAKLAREAGMCYGPVALITDYDVWKQGEEVTAEQVLDNLKHNGAKAHRLIADVVPLLDSDKPACKCAETMKTAFVTAKKNMPKAEYKKLKVIIDAAI